jgi:hypothetical protein
MARLQDAYVAELEHLVSQLQQQGTGGRTSASTLQQVAGFIRRDGVAAGGGGGSGEDGAPSSGSGNGGGLLGAIQKLRGPRGAVVSGEVGSALSFGGVSDGPQGSGVVALGGGGVSLARHSSALAGGFAGQGEQQAGQQPGGAVSKWFNRLIKKDGEQQIQQAPDAGYVSGASGG